MHLNPNSVITTDLDGVVVDFTTPFIDYCNAKYGTSFRSEDFTHHTLARTFGCDRSRVMKDLDEFYKTEAFLKLPAMPGSVEAISKIAETNTIFGSTSRPIYIKDETETCLRENFGRSISGVYFSTKNERKVDISIDLGAKYHLEDNLDYAAEFKGSGVEVLLFDSPWNDTKSDHLKELFPSGELPAYIRRAGDWRRGINPWDVLPRMI